MKGSKLLGQRIVATIEARMTSSRLPGKVLMDCQGKPMLELMIERLRRVSAIDQIVIATTSNTADNDIEQLAHRLNVGCFRGSEENVMERVLGAAKTYGADVIVETTGDCPLIDPEIIHLVIQDYLSNDVDYAANILDRTYPIGMDTQVFSTLVLEDAFSRTNDPHDHEHVSLFIYRHPEIYTLFNRSAPEHHYDPELRLTLDTIEDYVVINTIYSALYAKNPAFKLDEILSYLNEHPEVRSINSSIKHRWV